jgi:hypothetical protein
MECVKIGADLRRVVVLVAATAIDSLSDNRFHGRFRQTMEAYGMGIRRSEAGSLASTQDRSGPQPAAHCRRLYLGVKNPEGLRQQTSSDRRKRESHDTDGAGGIGLWSGCRAAGETVV